MGGSLHRRVARVIASGLAAVWLATGLAAGAAVTPAMHCHHGAMPCCPPAGSESAQCSGAQCTEAVPQKAETGVRIDAPALRLQVPVEVSAERPSPSPARAMTAGLRFQASVFRLKDDLRI
ncbi:MAG TPA: hypothetical protein VIY53_21390 [Acidobacteriaceae bacterium]